MKVCLLVQESQRSIFDTWYDAIAAEVGHCDIIRVSADDQKNLQKYIADNDIDLNGYDRVILFLRYKKMMRQVAFVRTIPNLVIIELDTFQNYCESKYNGKFSAYFGKIPWVRVMCTGKGHSASLVREGFDACFVPKAYDHKLLKNLYQERDIEMAFIGSLQMGVYQYRKAFLERLAERQPLHIERTNSGAEYLQILNRIKFFIGADIPFHEYMIKNFEAMACGCVLFTWDNGAVENDALGFVDMENVVLYRTMDELLEKLQVLRTDEALAGNIAATGQQLVEHNHTWAHAAKRLAAYLEPPLRVPVVDRSVFGLVKTYGYEEPRRHK